ncbi:hypothetical protein R3P38DRAFT_2869453 [Favolaschia claudopus]|uniref:Alpha/gamma-adaptin-binding protein p34 n=1 Tax=Favolaschia claudopus TaxID=2862362 RepID=A0AAW0D7C6_9AGAR
MSSAGSIEFSSLDSSTCRILVLSSALDRAVATVDRIRNLQGAQTPTSQDPGSSSSSAAQIPEEARVPGLGESTRIPWTLSNKYYSADVHFAAHTITGLAPHVVRNVPAVIFVWSKGEDYRGNVERISGDMSGYEPEVALGVRVAPLDGNSDSDADEDEAEIDEFLSSNGFEFIDASQEHPPSGDEEADRHPFSQGIPGLPRVLDALSTIMWPSMQARKAKPLSSRVLRHDMDWATQVSQDDLSPIKTNARMKSKEQEMEELTRWLEGEEDDTSRQDPWRSSANASTVVSSPTTIDSPGFPETTAKQESGFDDDFTVFVSAPAAATPGEDDDDSFADDSFDSPTEERLGAPGASSLYLSLGSGLDLRELGESEGKAEKGEDVDEDEDIPTDAEIEAMSERIFGTPFGKNALSGEESELKKMTAPDGADVIGGDNDEYDMASFDLSRVMSALQGMKAEIANMEDEGERRKAAAKVALGLVYGLEADAGAEDL